MNKLKLRDKLSLLFLTLFSLWAIWPFLTPGLPNTHDGQHHTVRLAAFHQALVDGQYPPRWAGYLNNGYGSPVLSFSFPLPFLIGELFHIAGLTFIDSFKSVFVLGFLLSGITMYLFLRKLTDSLSSFVGTFLYLFIPYRFLDMYVRGEVGESLFFVFPPLFLLLIWNVKKKDWLRIFSASLSVAAMLLSHPILAGIFITIFFCYFLLRRNLQNYFLSIALGSALAAFNILPIVLEKSFTNAGLFIKTNYQNQFPSLKALLYSRWNWGPALPDNPEISMAFQLGVAQWVLMIFLALFLIRALVKKETKTNSNFRILVLSSILIILFLFLMTPFSLFLWDKIFVLQSILYPWRLLGVEVFLTALAGSMLINSINNPKTKVILGIVLVFLAFYGNRNHNQVVGRTTHDDLFYASFTGTADMWGEFLPKDVKPFEGKKPPQKIGVIGGGGRISQVETKTNEVKFNFNADAEKLVLINNLYYPGWSVYVDNRKIERETSDMIAFKIPEGDHFVRVSFSETTLRLVANILSLVSLVVIVFLMAFFLNKKIK